MFWSNIGMWDHYDRYILLIHQEYKHDKTLDQLVLGIARNVEMLCSTHDYEDNFLR